MNMIDIDWLRQFRVGPFSIFDFAIAYIGILLLSPLLAKLASKVHFPISVIQWIWLTLPIGIVTHLLIGQQTTLTDMFLDPDDYYLVKIVILFMLFMGLRDMIRKILKSFKK